MKLKSLLKSLFVLTLVAGANAYNPPRKTYSLAEVETLLDVDTYHLITTSIMIFETDIFETYPQVSPYYRQEFAVECKKQYLNLVSAFENQLQNQKRDTFLKEWRKQKQISIHFNANDFVFIRDNEALTFFADGSEPVRKSLKPSDPLYQTPRNAKKSNLVISNKPAVAAKSSNSWNIVGYLFLLIVSLIAILWSKPKRTQIINRASKGQREPSRLSLTTSNEIKQVPKNTEMKVEDMTQKNHAAAFFKPPRKTNIKTILVSPTLNQELTNNSKPAATNDEELRLHL